MDALTTSPIFETVVSLVLVWFLISIVVSGVVEIVVWATRYRAKYLWASLDLLLGKDSASRGAPSAVDRTKMAARGPSLDFGSGEEPTTFGSVVKDLPGVSDDPAVLRRVKRINSALLVDAIVGLQDSTSPPADFSTTSVGRLSKRLPASLGIDDRRRRVEAWVDEAMQQMSATYRSHARRIAIAVATVVVLVLGVDAAWNARNFYASSTSRAAAIATAQATTAADNPYLVCMTNGVPVTATSTPPATATPSGAAISRNCTSEGIDALDRLEVRRYRYAPITKLTWLDHPEGAGDWATLLGGLVFTIAAASMGAPFWFDVLKRLTGLRRSTQRT